MTTRRSLGWLSLVLLFMVPVVVQAQFNYTTNNGAITITGYSGPGGAVTIPDTINGWPVTSIGNNALAHCSTVTNVTIGTNVTSIGSDAFFYTLLTNITIPSNVTDIAVGAFFGCMLLAAINVDSQNTAYSSVDGVLFNKKQTALIQCPPIRIGNYAVPNTVTNLGAWAFYQCADLTCIVIPSSVTTIGGFAFYDCCSLTSITIPTGVTSIGEQTFAYCTSLVSITIPNTVTSIGMEAFSEDYSLMAVYYLGDAPSLGISVFRDDNKTTIYFMPGTTGWGATYGGLPTAPWLLPYPVVLDFEPNFGLHSNRFGFTTSWATNLNIVVEACTNLANHSWTSIYTNTLSGGTNYFSDPQWTNYPRRFYRVRSN
jgi:hypothetical protein